MKLLYEVNVFCLFSEVVRDESLQSFSVSVEIASCPLRGCINYH